ncbi:M81 family metallopeptidase [Nitriliruptor alkaliphilus]|uniref:M81 family metallopeptidase n=1 Tax=Nitriliruptor alkaliphilus TaxID=427918 RepID=UPI000697C2A3|nr:M81 family metallopeptidase [Nitriliruptor alkaliphilus]
MTTTRRRPRIAVAACFHETNTFARSTTDVAAFGRRGWLHGAALLDAYGATQTVVGGMIDGATEHDLDLVPTFGAYATPAGLVTADTFERIVAELCSTLHAQGGFDGVLLELHGAMVVEGDADPETRLLRSVREAVGDRPIAVVTDLHANLTARSTDLVDVLVGYRTNPHVDTYESGYRAAAHLARIVTGGLSTIVRHHALPVLAAPIAQRTAELPLLRLLATARALERRHRLVEVTVSAGYAYADVPNAGMSFTVTAAATAERSAEQALAVLAEQAWHHRGEFTVELPGAAEALRRAAVVAEQDGGPVAVADTGDNINGGSPGDTTWLLHEALTQPSMRVAATLTDPTAVTAAGTVGIGGRFEAELGGKADGLSGPPITGEATVRWVGECTFVNTGPMARGARVDMGRTAVVSLHNLDLLLQTQPVQPNDPEMFRSVGMEPASYALVLLKGAAALRAGWAPHTTGFVDAGTRGITDADLRRLPYRHLADVWPLTDRPASPTAPSVEGSR